ncbi:maleylpyruvate isomerase N-terminal domain-containing protein [Streptomyces desertarenae]|uniref:Maleylpyruvate isomerase N-terminal domain-containing protein n=1 Tax=Streptomyces desertarenae TaxID=2666184 RepID=A0ABW4PPP4_9ACTN
MPHEETPPRPADVLRAAYRAFGAVVERLDEERSWLPTGCAGWAARDLVLHCLCDVQRGLVAFHTPAGRSPDRDAVTYWREWRKDAGGDFAARRFPRVVAGMFPDFGELRTRHLETSAAVLDAADRTAAGEPVATQGHVLTAGDVMRTLAVEATVHHLDLAVSLDDAPGPSREGLAEVRRTLDGLLGRPAPASWDDAHYARVATGRAAPSDADRAWLGADARRLPLFG